MGVNKKKTKPYEKENPEHHGLHKVIILNE